MDIYNANNGQTMYPKPKLSIYTPRAPRPVDIAYQEAIIKQKKLEEKLKLQQPKPDQNKSEHDALIRGFLHLAHILLTSTSTSPYDSSTYATSSDVLHAKVQTQVQQQPETEQLEHYLQSTRSYKGNLSEKDTNREKHSIIKTYTNTNHNLQHRVPRPQDTTYFATLKKQNKQTETVTMVQTTYSPSTHDNDHDHDKHKTQDHDIYNT